MVQDFSFPKTTPWLQRIWWDLQPTPGRLGKALRMTFASVLLLVLMQALQMPYIAYGLYALFLIGRQSPSVSLRSGIFTVVTMSLVVAAELSVVILSDNDPMARLLSIAVGTFLAGMVVVCTSQPQLGSSWGLFYCVVIGYWERHAPAGTLVNNSLRLLAAFAIASACGIAVEYVFGGRSPVAELENQFSIRYRALEEMFTLYARQSSPQERLGAAIRVSRLAAAGQREMIDLYYQIAEVSTPALFPLERVYT
jgi:multidrug resistance protein MdtO